MRKVFKPLPEYAASGLILALFLAVIVEFQLRFILPVLLVTDFDIVYVFACFFRLGSSSYLVSVAVTGTSALL